MSSVYPLTDEEDLIYEGIATQAAQSHCIHFYLDEEDLIYEGIATPYGRYRLPLLLLPTKKT